MNSQIPRHGSVATALTEYAAVSTKSLTAYSETPPADTPTDLPTHWAGVIGTEGVLTGDGRFIEEGALEWETPLPFRVVLEDVGAHEGAVTVGRILTIERRSNGDLWATGDFDLGSEVGREAARLVGGEIMTGVSMDLDSVAFEVRVAAELLETSEDGEGPQDSEEPETDAEGRVTVYEFKPEDEIMVTTSARIRAATLVSIPAFASAIISATASPAGESEALVASAAPVEPPAAWFNMPEANGPTALTITDEGQVYGHLATWDVCHVADPAGAGVCVMAPKNTSGYAYFHTGAVKTAEGSLVPTGSIRFNTGHASMRANAPDAQAHYDNTGYAGADVHAVDGKHGIWVCGALRPGLTAEQIRTLRASPLSGDWRYVGGKLELVGALAVNLPGFPIPRTQGLVASGALASVVAAGMIAPAAAQHVAQFSADDARHLKRLVDRERLAEQRSYAKRSREARNRAKVASLASRRRASAAFTSSNQGSK